MTPRGIHGADGLRLAAPDAREFAPVPISHGAAGAAPAPAGTTCGR